MEGGPVQAFEGRTRGSWILHCADGFHYNIREVRGRRVRLRCRHRPSRGLGTGCPGTARVSLDTGHLQHLIPHNHDRDLLLPEDFELRRRMVEDARSDLVGTRIGTILREWRVRCANVHLASRFTRARMNSSLYAARSENYPRIPKTLIYLGVLLGLPNMRSVCKTVDGDDYIFQGVVGNQMSGTAAVIFASGRMLQFLPTQESIHVDSTFKKAPRKPKIMQIFNVVVKYGDNIVCAVRVLMRRRTEEAYTSVINYLCDIAPNFNPRRIHCDYELAQMNAFKSAFPLCRVVGCLWHYAVKVSQRAWRLGLAPHATDNPLVFEFIRCVCALPLLPMHLIWAAAQEFWGEVEASGWGPDLLPLFQYFEETWMPRINELSVFGDSDRTNNCSESDNRTLANVFPQNHPNVWQLVGGFVQLEYVAWCDKVAIDHMRPVAPGRRYSAILNDRRVRMASQLLIGNQITPAHFLHQASSAIHAAVLHGLRIGDVDSDSGSESEEESDED
ncbi:Phosphate acyltransferase [Frankliniella fusca]|uniref:Phosphate acyltransferase n=1 Tax=Frankliniella fusca TaxID=407009 RepID=A0AAE1LML8_9NEOP|nr:Phosphate acyltransferase [Frankliniella fusca]